MKICQTETYEAMSFQTARLIAETVAEKPDCVLGLATGTTPVGAYRLLSEWCREGKLSFARVRTVNLDEYLGLSEEDPHSYHFFMQEHLFRYIDARPENLHLPCGTAADPEAACRSYEDLIASLGGIDLQLLGIGRNGHIGFNEPGVSFDSGTHIADLTESTRAANARLFEHPSDPPSRAITMGIRTILSAKRILLAASGPEKAEALERAFTGPVTEQVPASVLQRHPDVVLIADREALSGLARRGFAGP